MSVTPIGAKGGTPEVVLSLLLKEKPTEILVTYSNSSGQVKCVYSSMPTEHLVFLSKITDLTVVETIVRTSNVEHSTT